jgi:enterochelin esterase family protein
LPPGYNDSPLRYPTVYCLTGFTGRGKQLLNDNAFTPNLAERMDKLIAAGTIKPMIAVMPNCFTHYGGSQYINSTATGKYEDYLTHAIVPFVDENFRTVAERNQRAVMGKSSGGYGSLIMGLRHSELFGLVCCTSGDAYFEYCYPMDFPKAFRVIKGDPKRFMREFWGSEKHGKDDHAALNTIGMAACYSPNGQDFDLPFDLGPGEMRRDVWDRWLQHDPVRLAEKYAENLRSLKLLFIDAGTRDEFNLDIGAKILSRKLTELGVAHIHEEFDDGHFNISYRFDRSLELISENIFTAKSQVRREES